MAEVYKAYQPALDRYVALKLMHAFLAGDQDFISRFEREAKNVAALRHPNIIQVFDFDVHNGTPYMVMEFVEGGTLKTHLENLARDGKKQALSEALHIIREVGKALAYAHQRNMIHRDVKPANVLLEPDGRVILTDFGIAKILTGPSFTMTGATVGTPAYMSPEQSLGRPGDHRSDVYALGVMLYQLATGQLPYEADTPLAVMLKHVNEPLPLPRTFMPDLPEGVERIILKSMAKNPDDRFQSADEMLSQLNNLDTATHLPIPPASMAAGQEAHAITRPPGMEPTPGQTMVHPGGAPGEAGATRLSRAVAATATASQAAARPAGGTMPPTITQTPPPAAAPPVAPVAPVALPAPARPPITLFAVLGVIVVLFVLGGGAFAMTGGFGLFRQPSEATEPPTSTEAPPSDTAAPSETVAAGTSTPDAVATQLGSIQQTQAAISAELATPTPSETPDLTATAAACTYGFEVSGQDPPDGRTLNTGVRTRKTITITNTGVCAFPAGTVFTETVPATGLPPIQLDIPEVAPGEDTTQAFDWPGPTRAGQMARVFELRLPGDITVGEPVTFTFSYVVAATPRPAASPTPAAPTATTAPAGQPLSDIFPQDYTSCSYQGDGQMDYRCTARFSRVGGVGPFTLYVDGVRIGVFSAGQPLLVDVVGRRCLPTTYTVRLVDDGTVTEVSNGFFFDPPSYPNIFPGGGACTQP
jgi:hypothetical protein